MIVVQLFSSCCPFVVQSKKGQQTDIKTTSIEQEWEKINWFAIVIPNLKRRQVFLLSIFIINDAVQLFGDKVLAIHVVDAEELKLIFQRVEPDKDAVGYADEVRNNLLLPFLVDE